jgi:hypothetical protein
VSAARRSTAPSNVNASKPEPASRRQHQGADTSPRRRLSPSDTPAGRRRLATLAWFQAPTRGSFIRTAQGVGSARPAVGCCLAGSPPWQANGPPGLSCLETAKRQPDPRVGRISVARPGLPGKPSPSSPVTSHRFRGRRSQLPCFAASASKFS